jgi:putative protease
MSNNQEEGKLIGKITHYFDKIGVAVIELSDGLKVGDTIRIVGGETTDFEQTVDSMEMEHEKIEKAKKGDEVGMKVKEKAREGYKVYKI